MLARNVLISTFNTNAIPHSKHGNVVYDEVFNSFYLEKPVSANCAACLAIMGSSKDKISRWIFKELFLERMQRDSKKTLNNHLENINKSHPTTSEAINNWHSVFMIWFLYFVFVLNNTWTGYKTPFFNTVLNFFQNSFFPSTPTDTNLSNLRVYLFLRSILEITNSYCCWKLLLIL